MERIPFKRGLSILIFFENSWSLSPVEGLEDPLDLRVDALDLRVVSLILPSTRLREHLPLLTNVRSPYLFEEVMFRVNNLKNQVNVGPKFSG